MFKNVSITLPKSKLEFIKNYNIELENKIKYKVGVSNILEVCIDGISTGVISHKMIENAIKNEFIAQKKSRATKRYVRTMGQLNTL